MKCLCRGYLHTAPRVDTEEKIEKKVEFFVLHWPKLRTKSEENGDEEEDFFRAEAPVTVRGEWVGVLAGFLGVNFTSGR